MLKSCKYCGRIHDSKFNCGKKPQTNKKNTKETKFHGSREWTKKSIRIRERDAYLCQCCIRKMKGTVEEHNYKNNISVHHIEPLSQAWDKRLDDGNLITLCGYHHEEAEKGNISRRILKQIAEEQNSKVDGM